MSHLSTPVIAILVIGSIAAVLAVGLVAGRLITRRRDLVQVEPAKADEPASFWPRPSLQRIREETARRPPLSGPEI